MYKIKISWPRGINTYRRDSAKPTELNRIRNNSAAKTISCVGMQGDTPAFRLNRGKNKFDVVNFKNICYSFGTENLYNLVKMFTELVRL